jgi:hypothetical protein
MFINDFSRFVLGEDVVGAAMLVLVRAFGPNPEQLRDGVPRSRSLLAVRNESITVNVG